MKRIIEVAIPLIIFLAVFLLWLGAWGWIDNNISATSTSAALTLDSLSAASSVPPSTDITSATVRGQFGDKFGAINALFSGFAFAGIIFTIYLQRIDLRKTREAMSHDRFDNTFFQLLQVHIAITEKINIGNGAHMGRQAFERFNEYFKVCDTDFHTFCALQKLSDTQILQIKNSIAETITKANYPELEDHDIANIQVTLESTKSTFDSFLHSNLQMHEEKVVAAYTKCCTQYIDNFSHYFRNLYHILKFIDESTLISEEEKTSYGRFVRSQLSQVELVTLFYNSISQITLPGREKMELGFPKMGALIKRFDLLQNLSPRSLIHPIHQEIFDHNNKVEK